MLAALLVLGTAFLFGYVSSEQCEGNFDQVRERLSCDQAKWCSMLLPLLQSAAVQQLLL